MRCDLFLSSPPPPFSSFSTHQPSYGISSCFLCYYHCSFCWPDLDLLPRLPATLKEAGFFLFLHVTSIRYVPFKPKITATNFLPACFVSFFSPFCSSLALFFPAIHQLSI